MTKQEKLKEMLSKRNPLLEVKREAVTPVDCIQNHKQINKRKY